MSSYFGIVVSIIIFLIQRNVAHFTDVVPFGGKYPPKEQQEEYKKYKQGNDRIDLYPVDIFQTSFYKIQHNYEC